MAIGLFEALGPVMIGPSSSHTAGALRLARIAAIIADKPFDRVTFGLHGSFARTAVGHGTDRALLAGVLGYHETDPEIRDIFQHAAERGVGYDFYEIELPEEHENTCLLTFYHEDYSATKIIGSSVGGGQILITEINGLKTEITAQGPTLLIWQLDRRGVISEITGAIASENINIGVMRVSRDAKGQIATSIIETDSKIPREIAPVLLNLDHVIGVRIINI